MSAKVFSRALGLKGYDVVDCWETADDIKVSVELPRWKWRCSECRSSKVTLHEWHDRAWKNVPIGLKPTTVFMRVPRVKCADCGACCRIEVSFAAPLLRHTQEFEKYAASLLHHMTPQDVANHVGIAWGTANAIDKRRLKALPTPRLRRVKRIAIDEIYAGKLHKFMTIVLDLDSGAVLFVGTGRGSAALQPFFQKLRDSKAKIKAVAIDMAGGYIKAVEEELPQATLVFDHFHIVKLMNDKLTQLRRQEYHLASKQDQAVLKGVRWLLLKNPDPPPLLMPLRPQSKAAKQAEERRQKDRERLEAALKLNQSLATAYIMKEELRLLWSQASKAEATNYLTRWCQRADLSGIKVLQTMSKTLLTHARAILAWYDEPISTGRLEATNNKIKLLQRRAYGYRNREHFDLRILHIHNTKLRLVG